MVLLSVDWLGCRVRRGISHTDTVLDEPFVDGLGGMCHEHSAPEVGLRQYVGKRGRVIDMETKLVSRPDLAERNRDGVELAGERGYAAMAERGRERKGGGRGCVGRPDVTELI